MTASVIGGSRTVFLVILDSTDHREAVVFRTHDQRVEALGKQHKSGDSPVKLVVPGLVEISRSRIMDGLRKFIVVKTRGPRQDSQERSFGQALMSSPSDGNKNGVLRIFIDTSSVENPKMESFQ